MDQGESLALLASYEARFRLLSFVADAMVSSRPLEERADSLAYAIAPAFGVEACIIRLLEGDELLHLASMGLRGVERRPISSLEGIAATMIAARRPVTIRDVPSDPITAELAAKRADDKFVFRSYAGCPMIYEDKVIGILGVYSVAEPREFSELDLQHLQVIANDVGAVIVNGRLMQQLQTRTRELEEEIERREETERLRQEFEERFLRAQRFEALGLLVGTIAHDFNNLLVGILGGIDLALEDLAPGGDTERLLKLALKSSEAAQELCRQLLVYSGSAKGERILLDLNDCVRDFEEVLATSLRPGLALKLRLASVPLHIVAEPSALRQVLLNLVRNASDAMADSGGEIVIATHLRHCTRAELEATDACESPIENDYVVLEMIDTGCGMTPETKSHVLDPFYTTKQKGHGLGLASVIGIVRRHRGALAIDSEPGRGSTFRILLPAAQEEDRASAI